MNPILKQLFIYLIMLYNWWYHLIIWMNRGMYLKKHSRKKYDGESPWEYLDYQEGIKNKFDGSIKQYEPFVSVIVSIISSLFYLSLL